MCNAVICLIKSIFISPLLEVFVNNRAFKECWGIVSKNNVVFEVIAEMIFCQKLIGTTKMEQHLLPMPIWKFSLHF
jgi:hypothetical protein